MIYASWNLSHLGTKGLTFLLLSILFFKKKIYCKNCWFLDHCSKVKTPQLGVFFAVWLHITTYLTICPSNSKEIIDFTVTVRNECHSSITGLGPPPKTFWKDVQCVLFLQILTVVHSPLSLQRHLFYQEGALLASPLAALVNYNSFQYYLYHNIYI